MKKGQVWIETVIYTLIAFVLIGAVLAVARPKIEEIQDKAVIEQSMTMLRDINSQVLSVARGGAGNKRVVEIILKKGLIKIDADLDKIYFEIQTRLVYSEPDKNVQMGDITAYTEKKGELNLVTLSLDYSEEYNLLYDGEEDSLKTISPAPSIQKISIFNQGEESGKLKINIGVE